MHARGACRHTGQTAEAAINVFDCLCIRHPLVLEHILDQIDSAPRAVQLVAQHLIGRASCSAKPAMHASAQDFIGALGTGIFQLLFGKWSLHVCILTQPAGWRLPNQTMALLFLLIP